MIRSATKLTADLIERATNLKVIGRAGVGVDNVDVEAATRRGIVVANAPESTVVSAAEQTVGLLVALARNIPQAHAALKQGRWERSQLGRGRARGEDARRARLRPDRPAGRPPRGRARDARSSPTTRSSPTSASASSASSTRPTEDDVLAAADFLTLHSPLTDETRGMINRETIAKMKDGARIVNAARGALIDEEALAEALELRQARRRRARRLLRPSRTTGRCSTLDDVVVTPHLAASTDEAQDRAGRDHRGAGRRGARRAGSSRMRSTSRSSTRPSLEVLGPFIPLAAKLGRLAVELAGGRPRRVVVAAHGPLSDYDTRLLTVAALDGIFQGRVDQTVNYVNASLLAAERGITVTEERLRASRDYMNVVEVRVTAEGGEEVEVSGTTIGPEPRLFLASAYGFGIDIELAPDMVFFRYDDIPGVIGKVGTLFGANGVQHREHGGLADARRPAGADGALGRRAALRGADRGDAQRRLRRRDLHRARLSRR